MTESTATVAWIDATAGVAGDMLLGALLDLGWESAALLAVATALGLGASTIDVSRARRHGIVGVRVQVTCGDDPPPERRLPDILERIGASGLPQAVVEHACRTFELLAEAEAQVHGASPADVHFHEVGAADAMVDIVGVCAGLHALGIERVVGSPLPMPTGTVTFSHGTHALPAPAVGALIEGLPVFGMAADQERVTPTGVALMRALCDDFGPMPAMVVRGHGRGAGSRDGGQVANLLRIFVGEPVSAAPWHEGECRMVEANIDDMRPQLLPAAIDAILAAGAADVTVTPIQMKKGRPGQLLSALCSPSRVDAVVTAMMVHTTTIGCRILGARKVALARKTMQVATPWGEVPVKISGGPSGPQQVRAEYEPCAALAVAASVPVLEVTDAAEAAARETLSAERTDG